MLERLGNALIRMRLGWMPLLLAAVSVVVLMISVLVDTAVTKLPTGKQVGYIWAPNWTLSTLVVFPLLGAVGIGLLRAIGALVDDFQEHKMIVSKRLLRPVSRSSRFEQGIKRTLGAGLVVWIVLCTFGLGASAKEWWGVCVQPIQELCTRDGELMEDCGRNAIVNLRQIDQMNRGHRSFEVEKDWSVAAVFQAETSPWENILFDAVVFLGLQTAMIGTLAFFIVVTVTLVLLLIRLWGAGDLRLVPYLRRDQKRGGFERLEKPAMLILTGVLAAFSAFYFTTLQNTYLRQPDTLLVTDSISQPLFEVAKSFTERQGQGVDLSTFWAAATSIQLGSDYSTTWASLGSVALLVVFWILVVCAALVVTPMVAKRNLRNLMGRLAPQEFSQRFGMSQATAGRRLNKMLWWPYEYLPLNLVLSVGFVLFAAVFQPGIVLAMVGLAVGVSIVAVVARFWGRYSTAGVE